MFLENVVILISKENLALFGSWKKSLFISVITFMKVTLLNTINVSPLYKISSDLKATYPDLLLLV